eukprot:TRINITY_DN35798_c0_g1_i1.p1 TRINITY_DN35798_c0_g1~~TRINITY_DN35798_c0_g1_i1.p1  ORF type:complete len:267 (+),score=60.22 TRINITY_DN35798_c0_g1_i1:41-802(+)
MLPPPMRTAGGAGTPSPIRRGVRGATLKAPPQRSPHLALLRERSPGPAYVHDGLPRARTFGLAGTFARAARFSYSAPSESPLKSGSVAPPQLRSAGRYGGRASPVAEPYRTAVSQHVSPGPAQYSPNDAATRRSLPGVVWRPTSAPREVQRPLTVPPPPRVASAPPKVPPRKWGGPFSGAAVTTFGSGHPDLVRILPGPGPGRYDPVAVRDLQRSPGFLMDGRVGRTGTPIPLHTSPPRARVGRRRASLCGLT